MIFTACLKRGNYGSFCNPDAFNSHFDNSVWLKGCLSENRPSPLVQNDHYFEAETVPLLSFSNETRTVMPFFTCVFYLLWLTKKYIIIKGEKSG